MKKILIIDDEKDIAELCAARLRANGYTAFVAFDGREGLAKLKEITPDLILLDLSMPGMGGLEFYRHISGPDQKPQYRVLVLTAHADLEPVFRDIYVDGFIVKPFEGKRLLEEIEIILGRQGSEKRDEGLRRIRHYQRTVQP